MQNTKNIHFFFEDEISTFTNAINHGQFKRRYPGKHVAVAFCQSEITNNFFDEVIHINTEDFQRISFSPILGDEIALNIIYQKLSPFTQDSYAWSFNLFGNSVCNAFQQLFACENNLGFISRSSADHCDDPSLRILKSYLKTNKGNCLVSNSLLQKALKQFDQENFKSYLLSTVEHKFNTKILPTKKILIADLTETKTIEDENIISNAAQIFCVVNTKDENFNNYIFDASLVSKGTEGINISSLDFEEVLASINSSLLKSINQWFVRLILAEYLSLPKTSFAFEKIIATYPKSLLQDFMISQLSELKEFVAQIILSERNKNQLTAVEALNKYSSKHSPLAMTLMIHASQIEPNEAERIAKIETLKSRLRNLNSLYERIYRLCSIDIPKSDLALTL